MNNEPVAELLINDGEPWGCRYSDEGTLFNADGSRMDGWIPLYTHPVKEKQSNCEPNNKVDLKLTDEEIFKEMEFLPSSIAITNEDLIKFAKAILRKAQEK